MGMEIVAYNNSNLILNNVGESIASSSLVAWYKFDGSGTNLVLDSSPNAYNLTNYSATFDAANFKKGTGSAYFNGSTQYMDIPSSINPYAICNANGITFSVWFKASTSSGLWARVFDFGDNDNPSHHVLISAKISNGTNNRFAVKVSGSETAYDTPVSYCDNTWHHFAWSISSTGVWTIYIDNVNQNVNITRTIPNVTWNRRFIGRSTYTGDGYYVGNIDDFRIFNKVLSSTEVNQLYNTVALSANIVDNLYLKAYTITSNIPKDEFECLSQEYV
jgi:hypothetical protein